jgi:hypothetical protein
MGGSVLVWRACWAALSRMTGWDDSLPVLIRSDADLLTRSFWTFGPLPSLTERRFSSSSGGPWIIFRRSVNCLVNFTEHRSHCSVECEFVEKVAELICCHEVTSCSEGSLG